MKARTHGRIRIEDGDKRVRAMLGGVVVADSANVKYVWEKPYYPTYYFPVADVRMDLLTPSDLHTACPCKGEASYYHVAAGDETLENHVWWYPAPVVESQKIAGYVCFYNEKVDIYIDGELVERPRTMFS